MRVDQTDRGRRRDLLLEKPDRELSPEQVLQLRSAPRVVGHRTGRHGIHQHPSPSSSDAFDELRPGLDHVAFGAGTRADLESWLSRLDELGIENGGIVDAPYGSGLSFRDPDNIALEFFAPPG